MRLDARYHNGNTRLRALLDHPMETGNRKDAQGTVIPSLYIQSLTIKYQEEIVVDARLSAAIARNPYFSFEFVGGRVGEEVTVEWTDSAANQQRQSIRIA